MICSTSSTIQVRRIAATIYYVSTDSTSAYDSTTSTTSCGDDVVYTYATAVDSSVYEELLKFIKAKRVYPWELESPILKFVKPVIVDEQPVFDRKLFINAYKSARSTIAKINLFNPHQKGAYAKNQKRVRSAGG